MNALLVKMPLQQLKKLSVKLDRDEQQKGGAWLNRTSVRQNGTMQVFFSCNFFKNKTGQFIVYKGFGLSDTLRKNK